MSRVIIFLLCLLLADSLYAGSLCTGQELTKDQLIKVLERERIKRSDLPKAYPQSGYLLNKKGCFYILIEYAVPERPGKNIVFTLNRDGVIIDVMRGR